ncbi:MAG: PKD domain-containing protein [Fimbriimonadaceae bacterium]|nr:PKD domain-containing protein [Fimbriimonadaceae bacterium]QYK57976.1 MAG: PKD domain-containing protein [Fimbriimonadaceae bacterium]
MFTKSSILALAVISVLFGSASAQTVYSPTRPTTEQGIRLAGWGSGTISETDETAFEGTASIRVSSRNFFQGGILMFGDPVSISGAMADKANTLKIVLKVPDQTVGGGGASAAGGGGGRMGTEDGGETGMRGGGQGARGGSSTTSAELRLETLRLVIATSDGKRSEAFIDLKGLAPDQRGWVMAAVPLQAIAGLERTNHEIQSIAFAGDAVASFFIGEISVESDTTPIYADVNHDDLNLALGDSVTFVASGSGGSSQLVYEWDFDAADGIQVDAEGQSIVRVFRKPGEFTITLKVRDAFGLKEPFTRTIKVVVNP